MPGTQCVRTVAMNCHALVVVAIDVEHREDETGGGVGVPAGAGLELEREVNHGARSDGDGTHPPAAPRVSIIGAGDVALDWAVGGDDEVVRVRA